MLVNGVPNVTSGFSEGILLHICIFSGQYDFFDNGVVDLAGNMSYGPVSW